MHLVLKYSIKEHSSIFLYSLISIRQNYNFDMSATIWHELVSWYLTNSQNLLKMIAKLFLFWFSYQNRTILWSQQTRTGKKPEINKQCHLKWWLKYPKNRSVSLSFTWFDQIFFEDAVIEMTLLVWGEVVWWKKSASQIGKWLGGSPIMHWMMWEYLVWSGSV